MSENISRRNFLVGATVGVAAVSLAGCASSTPDAATNVTAAASVDTCPTPEACTCPTCPTVDSASVPANATETPTTTATGGKWSWEVVPDPISDDQIIETVEADVVIVGGGLAGVSCAQSAAEAGAKVVLLEKTAQCNGRGGDNASLQDKYHQEIGKVYDPADVEDRLANYTFQKADRHLIRFWCRNVSECYNWLIDKFSELGFTFSISGVAQKGLEESDFFVRTYLTPINFRNPNPEEGEPSGEAKVVYYLEKWAKAAGADFRYNMPAEQLVKSDDGSVHAVIAKDADGKYHQFVGSKGVVIATGDISGSDEMLQAYAPRMRKIGWNAYTPVGANTGDGIKMGLWVGAATQKFEAAPMVHVLNIGNGGYAPTSSFTFNLDGRRFMNESVSLMLITNACAAQPNATVYTMFDGNFKENALAANPENKSWDGSLIIDEKTDGKLQDSIDKGLSFKGETIEELATNMGIPADHLAETVKRYNELCEKGVDEDFSVPAKRLVPVVQPPFYASRSAVTILVVIYGLNCDSYSRVCDADDKPIEGLYALGNAQGNFFVQDYPMITPGISHSRCFVFGRKLGQAIAAGEQIAFS